LLSGGIMSPADDDAAYCAEIARRSAARAALHLGMEGMDGEALDVLGSVLLGYMDTVGETVSSNVEASGRSSAHSNAYDALNAIADCTAPAATQLGRNPSSSVPSSEMQMQIGQQRQQPNDDDNTNDGGKMGTSQERGWEGLASFLFGQDWFSIQLRGDDDEDENAALAATSSTAPANGTQKDPGNKDAKILQQPQSKQPQHGNGKTAAAMMAAAMGNKKQPGGKTMLPARPTNAPDDDDGRAATTAMTMASSSSTASSSSSPKKAGKGKQLNNMHAAAAVAAAVSANERAVSFSLGNNDDAGSPLPRHPNDDARWNAPYPHDVPAFPLVTNDADVANPHRMSSSASISMHDLAAEMEACREMPAPSPSAKRQRKGAVGGGERGVNGSNDSSDGCGTVTMTKAARLRDQAAERAARAALRIPDDVYSARGGGASWGSIRDEEPSNGAGGDEGGDAKRARSKGPSGKDDRRAPAAATAAASSKVKFDPLSSSKHRPQSSNAVGPPEHPVAPSSATKNSSSSMPPYVPNFLPPFPVVDRSPDDDAARDGPAASAVVMGDVASRMSRVHRERRKTPTRRAPSSILASTAAVPNDGEGGSAVSERDAISEREAVRRSVIGLGRSSTVGTSYWGSRWQEDDDGGGDDRAAASGSTTGKFLWDVTVAPGEGGGGRPLSSSSAKKPGSDASQVNPLGRASGSRLSKILEGSMNMS